MAYSAMSKDKMESIYRFISFSSFVDTIQRGALAFVHHSLWGDPYEGYIFKALKKQAGRKKIRDILSQLSPQLAIPIYGTLLHIDSCIHGQSWTKCPENEYLWRINCRNQNNIRIEVSLGNINKLNQVKAYEIDYAYTTLEEDVKAIIDAKNNKMDIAPILLRKRAEFSYEQEIRLLSAIDLNYLRSNRSPAEIKVMESALKKLHEVGEINQDQYECGMNNICSESKPRYKYIEFNHIPGFINTVMVSPNAEDWFVETVETYCSTNNLHFVGKSRFHDLII